MLMQTQRLRFDFNLPRGMKPDEVQQVEDLVNSWIQQDHTLSTHVVPLQEAKDKGQLTPTSICAMLSAHFFSLDALHFLCAPWEPLGSVLSSILHFLTQLQLLYSPFTVNNSSAQVCFASVHCQV